MQVNANTQIVQTQALLMARYSSTRSARTGQSPASGTQESSATSTQAMFEANFAALDIRVSGNGQEASAVADTVQIDLSGSMSIRDAHKILKDQMAEKINAAFKEADVQIDIRDVQNQDTSPEATSRRIVDFATGFFGVYAKNHTKDGQPEQLDGFMSLIRDAIDQGFADAREIMKGIADIGGPITDNIDKTYELTQKGLDDFRKKQLDLIGGDQGGNSKPPAEAATAVAI